MAEVVLRQGVAFEEEAAHGLAEAGHRRLGKEVRRRGAQRNHLGERRLHLGATRAERPQPVGPEVVGHGARFEGVEPAGDAAVEVVALLEEEGPLVVDPAAEQPRARDEVVEQLAASLLGEELRDEVLEHGLLEHLGAHPVAVAALLPRPQRAAAVVVAVRVRAVRVALAGGLELEARPAPAALHEPREQQRARAGATGVAAGLALFLHALGEVEDLAVDDGLGGDRDPVVAVGLHRSLRRAAPPPEGADRRLLADDTQHGVFGPEGVLAVPDAAPVELPRHALRAVVLDVEAKHLPHHGHLVGVGQQLASSHAGPHLDALDPIAEGGVGAVEVALLRVLTHRGAGAEAVHLRLVLIDEFEDALDELPHRVVGGLLLDRDHADALAPQGVLERPSARGVAQEAARVEHEHGLHVGTRGERGLEHRAEHLAVVVGAARPRLDVLRCHLVATLHAVAPHRVDLRGQRKLSLRLLRRAHPRVEKHASDLGLRARADAHDRSPAAAMSSATVATRRAPSSTGTSRSQRATSVSVGRSLRTL
ncbi:MAG: hypothetical protein U0324_37185 [Polyangiales bacterium]